MASRANPSEIGQGLIEFVIVTPAVLMLVFLAWELCYFWWGRMVVSTAAFEAARQVASTESVTAGYAAYDDVMRGGLGRMSQDYPDSLSLAVQPEYRSVYARTNVPWHWPSGLGALMGGPLNLTLKASAFFRLEQFYPGPPDTFE